MSIILENKDCFDFMSNIPDESIDLALLDPPYFIGYEKWDKQWLSEAEYLAWCKKWTIEAVRCLKRNRPICVWGTLKTDAFLRYKLDVLNSIPGLYPQNEIIWSYNWGGRTKKNFARKHEYVWVYSKGDLQFDADSVRIERKQKINIRTGELFTQGTIPTCVWEKNNHTTSKEYCAWHSTQKPISLLERIIKAYTLKDETVLDIFSGSGSTMIAAHNVGRNFVGTELDNDYYTKSIDRFKALTGVSVESTNIVPE